VGSATSTVFDPPRLALVSGFVAAVAWLLTWTPIRPTGVGWIIVVSIVGLGTAVSIALGVLSAQRRWARVARALDAPLDDAAEAARLRARRPAIVMAAVGIASVVPLSIALLQGNVLLIALGAGVTATLAAIATRLATSAHRGAIPGRDRRTITMVVVFGLLGGILPLVQVLTQLVRGSLPEWLAPDNRWNLLVLVIGAAAVTIALTVDWLRIGRSVRAIGDTRGVNWVTVTIASVGVAALAHWIARLATAGVPSLLADTIAAGAFIVVWANVVWWMPELVRRIPDIADRVVRAPLAPVVEGTPPA